jgi:hypothetical protein
MGWMLSAAPTAAGVAPITTKASASSATATTSSTGALVANSWASSTGGIPLWLEKRKGKSWSVRVPPLVLVVSEREPYYRVPSHVDERWPLSDVPVSSVVRTPPALPPAPPDQSVVVAGLPDLQFGCALDPVGAVVVDGDVERTARLLANITTTGATNVCAVRLDARTPCPTAETPATDPPQDPAKGSPAAQLLARIAPRLSGSGPALTFPLQPVPGSGTLFLVEHLLESARCGCGDDVAGVTASRVVPMQLPKLTQRTSVWIEVPRYTAAMYDVVVATTAQDVETDALTTVSYTDTFESQPPEDPNTMRAFSAPNACECTCGDDDDLR